MSGLAEKTGLNRTALYETFYEDGNATLDTVMRVMCALNINARSKLNCRRKRPTNLVRCQP